jgi:HEAT repeat protein
MVQLLIDHELFGEHHRRYEAITAALQLIAGVPSGFGGMVNQDLGAMLSLLTSEQIGQLTSMADGMFGHMQKLMPADTGNRIAESLAQQFDIRTRYQHSQTRARSQVDVLIEWLSADDANLRIAAPVSLPWYSERRALEPLHIAMQDRDDDVRIAARWAHDTLETTLGYRGQL